MAMLKAEAQQDLSERKTPPKAEDSGYRYLPTPLKTASGLALSLAAASALLLAFRTGEDKKPNRR